MSVTLGETEEVDNEPTVTMVEHVGRSDHSPDYMPGAAFIGSRGLPGRRNKEITD